MSHPRVLSFIVGAAAVLAIALSAAGPPAAAQGAADHAIVDAIGVIADRPGAWTKGGKPRVDALEAELGRDITAAERDVAWAAYQAGEASCERIAKNGPSAADLQARLDAATSSLVNAKAGARATERRLADAQRETRAQTERAERAESSIASAERSARAARRDAVGARELAVAAEAKTRGLLAGRPACADERAVVRADDSWRAASLRRKVERLLACLAVGEA